MIFSMIERTLRCTPLLNQSNAWDAWRWRKSMWLAIHDGAITVGVSLHEDMTKLMLYQSEAGRCSWNTDC